MPTTPEGIPRAAKISRRWPVISASVAVGVVLALGALIIVRSGEPFALDLAWMSAISEHRSPVLLVAALFFDYVGGGILGSVVIPVLIFLTLFAFRRPWGATFFAIASIVSAVCVQVLKHTVGRERPSELLVHLDTGSFPSGHTANAATMAVVLGILFPRVWVWCSGVLWATLMALSRTYLGVHWLTDTIAGLLLGAGVAIIVWAPLAYRLAWERTLPHPFLRGRAGPPSARRPQPRHPQG